MHQIGEECPKPLSSDKTRSPGHDEWDVLSLRFIASEAMLVDLERANLRFER